MIFDGVNLIRKHFSKQLKRVFYSLKLLNNFVLNLKLLRAFYYLNKFVKFSTPRTLNIYTRKTKVLIK